MHAIGDRGNRNVLDAYAAAGVGAGAALPHRARAGGRARRHPALRQARRHRLDAADARHQRLAVGGQAPRRGAPRGRLRLAPHARRRRALAFGSDFPVEKPSVVDGFRAAVERAGWTVDQKLTLDETLRAFTSGAAFAAFEEAWRGRAAPGMAADLTVFDRPAADLIHARADLTIVGGRVVYERRAELSPRARCFRRMTSRRRLLAGLARRRRRHDPSPRASPPPPKPKKILILGGTGFLGPALVAAARAHGHTLTLFNRGKTNPGRFTDLEQLHGDRDGHLEALGGGRKWDVVIDDSGYVPRHVKDSATLLGAHVGHYVFVSTISVYADLGNPADESAPVAKLKEPTEKVTGESYGALKALCEEAATAAMPGRVTVVRPGLIVGPEDPTDRFTYWPVRMARGGEVLAPGDAERSGRLHRRARSRQLDDLARRRAAPPRHLQRARPGAHASASASCSTACNEGAGSEGAPDLGRRRPSSTSRACSRGATCRCGCRPSATANTRASSAARARSRPGSPSASTADTTRDTLAWWNALPEARRAKLRAGLAADKEQAVLAAWHAAEARSDKTDARK